MELSQEDLAVFQAENGAKVHVVPDAVVGVRRSGPVVEHPPLALGVDDQPAGVLLEGEEALALDVTHLAVGIETPAHRLGVTALGHEDGAVRVVIEEAAGEADAAGVEPDRGRFWAVGRNGGDDGGNGECVAHVLCRL